MINMFKIICMLNAWHQLLRIIKNNLHSIKENNKKLGVYTLRTDPNDTL